MDNPTFSNEFKEKIKKFLIRQFNVNPSDREIEESCLSLFYIGRAHARANKLRRNKVNLESKNS